MVFFDNLARATMAQNSAANVLPLLDRSIQLDSLNFFSFNLKGLILSERGDKESVENAKKIFIHVVTREPQFISAYVNALHTRSLSQGEQVVQTDQTAVITALRNQLIGETAL